MSRKDLTLVQKGTMLKKHIATVHVSGTLSYLARKTFNALLENAYPNLVKQRRHKMRYSVLCELIGYESHDREPIKSALRTLASTPIEWIEEDEDGREASWQVHTYIS